MSLAAGEHKRSDLYDEDDDVELEPTFRSFYVHELLSSVHFAACDRKRSEMRNYSVVCEVTLWCVCMHALGGAQGGVCACVCVCACVFVGLLACVSASVCVVAHQ